MTLTPNTTYRAPNGHHIATMREFAREVGARLLKTTDALSMTVKASYEDGTRDRFVRELPAMFGTDNADVTITGDRIVIKMIDHSQELSERPDMWVDANDDGSQESEDIATHYDRAAWDAQDA